MGGKKRRKESKDQAEKKHEKETGTETRNRNTKDVASNPGQIASVQVNQSPVLSSSSENQPHNIRRLFSRSLKLNEGQGQGKGKTPWTPKKTPGAVQVNQAAESLFLEDTPAFGFARKNLKASFSVFRHWHGHTAYH